MKKICFVVSSEYVVKAYLLPQIAALSRVYEVSVAANTQDTGFLEGYGIDARVFAAPVERRILLLRDLRALASLTRLFQRERFDAVHSVSPKAGLLTAIGAVFARVPVRIHTFTGQVWATRRGASRFLLKNLDRLLSALTTHILVDSRSQREFLLAERVIPRGKSAVLANGSICGVDTARFRPDPEARTAIRRESNIAETDTLFIFLGRMNKDKGVLDLADAFSRVRGGRPNVHLLFVGPDEGNMLPRIREICSGCAKAVHHVDYTDVPERYMASADVLCLPSYREGFGNVVIEAGAAGLPVIATSIYGVTDAVEEGVTGVLYEPGNTDALAEWMERFAENREMRRRMGENGRVRAQRDFAMDSVTAALIDYYRTLWADARRSR